MDPLSRPSKHSNGVVNYVNPQICAHAFVATARIRGEQLLYAYCEVCGLQSSPVTIGRFEWWAKNKAFRKFYTLANTLDKEQKCQNPVKNQH